MVGEAWPVAERRDVEPFVEQELDVAPREQLGSHPGIIQPPGRPNPGYAFSEMPRAHAGVAAGRAIKAIIC
jgi:hypothetical protein